MKLHIVLPTFLSLVITLSAHAMEQDLHDLYPLLCLPLELQQQIAFPCGATITKITIDNVHEVKRQIKAFFSFKRVNTYFNTHLKLSWSDLLTIDQKNKMLQETMWCIESFNHRQAKMIPLALVYSGADADTKFENGLSCFHNAVSKNDESAVAMLLRCGADPYQIDAYGTPICFQSRTLTMINLFLEKIDKPTLLSKSHRVSEILLYNSRRDILYKYYSLEIMQFWFTYGVDPRCYIDTNLNTILHRFADSMSNNNHLNTFEDYLVKGELLLKCIPDMINYPNNRGLTALDLAVLSRKSGMYSKEFVGCIKQAIALLKKYGGKTAQELEEENAAQQ